MRPINCPIEKNQKKIKRYLRFVNKDNTDYYVDMRMARGQDVFKVFWPLIKHADEITERTIVFGEEKPRKYHYCILFSLDENNKLFTDEPPIGFFKRREKMFSMEINPDTNEMIAAYEIANNEIVGGLIESVIFLTSSLVMVCPTISLVIGCCGLDLT